MFTMVVLVVEVSPPLGGHPIVITVCQSVSKNFNIGHYLCTIRGRTFIFTWVFLVTRPFHLYQTFWSCDLNLWPTLKNFNIGHNHCTVRDRALIFDMCVPCDNTFPIVSHFYHVTLNVTFDLYLKNFNIVHNYSTAGYGVFIFHMGQIYMYSSWQDLSVHTKNLTLAPWRLTYISKSLTFLIDRFYLSFVAAWWASLSSYNSSCDMW